MPVVEIENEPILETLEEDESCNSIDQISYINAEILKEKNKQAGYCEEQAMPNLANAHVLTHNNDLYANSVDRILDLQEEKKEQKPLLVNCMSSIFAKLNGLKGLGRQAFYQEMFKVLTVKEQKFIAQILTAVGESGVLQNKCDYQLVMKVLRNRANLLNNWMGSSSYNELDAALAKSQFSMYNASKGIWKRYLQNYSPSYDKYTDLALDAYIDMDITDFGENSDELYMYHANYVSPDWAYQHKRTSPTCGSDSPKSRGPGAYHKFYRSRNARYVGPGLLIRTGEPPDIGYYRYQPKVQR